MSDDIDIRSGGAVAVDTDSLRHAAERYDALAASLGHLHAELLTERAQLLGIHPLVDAAAWRIGTVVRGAESATDASTSLAGRLRRAADVYEIVELLAVQDAALATGAAVPAEVGARLVELLRADPTLLFDALGTELAWRLAGPAELARQAGSSPLGAFGFASAASVAMAIGGTGRGRVPRGATLTGPMRPVTIQVVAGGPTVATAPTSLTSVVDRMPQGQAQVRVERYAMPDGSKRFAVYVAGTRALLDEREPWNGQSDVELYYGQRSASYDATVLALRDAGAEPGDAIYAFGHSQGGMIASHLALEGGYDTRALVTFGSPVSADVGPQTLSVQLRHVDDPVVALADGGDPATVGAPGSFVVERVADPMPGLQDVMLKAHGLDEYRETAVSVDASADPRVAALDAVFEELAEADSMDAYEYAATSPPVVVAPGLPGVDDVVEQISRDRAWAAG